MRQFQGSNFTFIKKSPLCNEYINFSHAKQTFWRYHEDWIIAFTLEICHSGPKMWHSEVQVQKSSFHEWIYDKKLQTAIHHFVINEFIKTLLSLIDSQLNSNTQKTCMLSMRDIYQLGKKKSIHFSISIDFHIPTYIIYTTKFCNWQLHSLLTWRYNN